jgi:hypothetical protein
MSDQEEDMNETLPRNKAEETSRERGQMPEWHACEF